MAHICNNTYTFQILLQLWKWLKSMTLKYLWFFMFFIAWRNIFAINTDTHRIHNKQCVLRHPCYFGCHTWNGASDRMFPNDIRIKYFAMWLEVFINKWTYCLIPSDLANLVSSPRIGGDRNAVARNRGHTVVSGRGRRSRGKCNASKHVVAQNIKIILEHYTPRILSRMATNLARVTHKGCVSVYDMCLMYL